MNVQRFKQVENGDKNIVLIDIREADEVVDSPSHVKARLVPMGELLRQGISGSLSKDTPIIVFCRSGYRAGIVARELTAVGYNIEALEGGLQALEETS